MSIDGDQSAIAATLVLAVTPVLVVTPVLAGNKADVLTVFSEN